MNVKLNKTWKNNYNKKQYICFMIYDLYITLKYST